MKPPRISALLVSVLLISGGFVGQSASAATLNAHGGNTHPEVVTPPAFSINSTTGVLSVDTPSVWKNGSTWVATSVTDQFFACNQEHAAGTGVLAESATWPGLPDAALASSCKPLYSNTLGTTPFTSGNLLMARYAGIGGANGVLWSSNANANRWIALFSYVENADGHYYVTRSASQEFTVAAPSLTDASSFVSSFQVDGSVASFDLASWDSEFVQMDQTTLYACADEAAAAITPALTSAVTSSSSCEELQFPNLDINNPVFDLDEAQVGWPAVSYDAAAKSHIVLMASITLRPYTTTYFVNTASLQYGGSSGASADAVRATPYTGPLVQTPGISATKRPGEALTLPGSNLSGVSKVEIAGLDCQVIVNSAGEIEIVVPTGLASGTYDLVITSDAGKLTVQDAIRIAGSAVASSPESVRPSSKLGEDSKKVKVRVFNVIGAGKVQIFVNGLEIAWIDAEDASDPKLFEDYLVRTIELVEGKNAIEVFIDGERVQRWAYWL